MANFDFSLVAPHCPSVEEMKRTKLTFEEKIKAIMASHEKVTKELEEYERRVESIKEEL